MNIIINIFKELFNLVKRLFQFVADLFFKILGRIYDKYLDVSVSEKLVFLNSIPAFIIIILPVARYYIFETYYYINNPLAVYMLGIIAIMLISLYFSGLVKLIVRILVNGYYLFWIIYLPMAGELTKANPHEITAGYYLNIAVPAVYIITSLFGYFYSYD